MKLRMIVCCAVVLVLMGGLWGVQAQSDETTGANYTLLAGMSGQGNVRFLSFVPLNVKVHRGDTITWVFGGGLHNVRFTQLPEWGSLIVPIEVEGTPHIIIDPKLTHRTLDSGDLFTGEDINSGVAFDMEHSEHVFDAEAPYAFSIIVDAEPGLYTYLCDVHPGMIGTIEVVEDDVEIPSPLEVSEQISGIVAGALESSIEEMYALEAEYPTTTEDGTLEVLAGLEYISGDVRVAVDRFYPSTGVIRAGESVSWWIADDATVVHTLVAPYLGLDQYITAIEDAEGNRQVSFTPAAFMPTITDGLWPADADYVNAGTVVPGVPLTITFPEPGVYPYSDLTEPGMTGTIVVLEAE